MTRRAASVGCPMCVICTSRCARNERAGRLPKGRFPQFSVRRRGEGRDAGANRPKRIEWLRFRSRLTERECSATSAWPAQASMSSTRTARSLGLLMSASGGVYCCLATGMLRAVDLPRCRRCPARSTRCDVRRGARLSSGPLDEQRCCVSVVSDSRHPAQSPFGQAMPGACSQSHSPVSARGAMSAPQPTHTHEPVGVIV
jgi:hypothetical protein